MPSNGVTISVTAETNAGGRKHMEDYIAVNLSPNETLRNLPDMKEQAYVGVFDGHGGKEAAKFAREELWEVIQNKKEFLSHDVARVKEAIKDAYLELHKKMLEYRASWQPNKTGDLSTAGTTASTVIFRKNHIFVANVGDSTAIMGIKNPHFGQPGEPELIAQVITRDHKPEDPAEQRLIRKLGGEVALSPKGVMRVVWERSRCKVNGTTEVDRIPFLSVARSLGDYWSYNPRTEEYTVSPHPDVSAFPLNLAVQKFVVIASDGLWNVMTPNDVVSFIYDYQNEIDEYHQPKDVVSALIHEALNRWQSKGLQADNIAVLIAFLSEEEPESCRSTRQQHLRSPLKKATGQSTSPSVLRPVSPAKESSHSTDHHSNHSPTPTVPDVSASHNPSSSQFSSSSSSHRHLSISPLKPPTATRESNPTFASELWSEGTVVGFETKMKMKRRKHRKHRRHGLERELARRGIHRFRRSTSATHHSVVLRPEPVPETSLTNSDQEFSMFGTVNGLKRQHSPAEEEDEIDEGILIPASQKRLREEETCSVDTVTSLRSQRLSTDTGSDSGSNSSSTSGVSSDSNIEEGLPEPASDDMILDMEDDKASQYSSSSSLLPNEISSIN